MNNDPAQPAPPSPSSQAPWAYPTSDIPPPQEPKKPRSTVLIAIASALAVVLVGGGAALAIFAFKDKGTGEPKPALAAPKTPTPTPEPTTPEPAEPTEVEEPEEEIIPEPTADELLAWGLGALGLLGDGVHHGDYGTDITYSPDAAVTSPQPVNMPGELQGAEFIQVSATTAHTLALTSDGEVFGWGWHGIAHLYGGGMAQDTMEPTKIVSLDDTGGEKIIKIATGALHSFALGESGSLYAWGFGGEGALGDGHDYPRDSAAEAVGDWDAAANFTPHKINDQGTLADVKIVDIASGPSTAFAIDEDGGMHGWGIGYNGMLGTEREFVIEAADWGHIIGDTHYATAPVVVDVGKQWRADEITDVQVGADHVAVLTNSGDVYSWGTGLQGQLGDGQEYTGGYGLLPDDEKGGNPHAKTAVGVVTDQMTAPVTKICVGREHTMALTADGTVWGWGANTMGQLAQAEEGPFFEPVKISGLPGSATDIGCGWEGGLALLADGDLYAWGWSGLGQLGDGVQYVPGGQRDPFDVLDEIFTSFKAEPTLVGIPENKRVTLLDSGRYHTVVGVL